MANLNELGQKSMDGYGIELRPIMPFDLICLRRWRNAPEISGQMKDSQYITPNNQRCWYERTRENPHQAHWVVWFKGVRTGYMNLLTQGGLEEQAYLEGGMYVGNSRVRSGLLGYAIALMQLKVVFEHTSIPRYQTLYKETNQVARRFNQHLGYAEEGLEEGFMRISMDMPAYKQTKARLSRYFERAVDSA